MSINSSDLTKICNNNQLINFEMKVNSDYEISLTVNNIIYHISNNLFNYSIDINIDESKYKLKDVITSVDDLIKGC